MWGRSVSLTTAVPAAGRIAFVSSGSALPVRGFGYDRYGRLVTRHQNTRDGIRTRTYCWDAADRLVAVNPPEGGEWHYRYDPLGLAPTPDGDVQDASPAVSEHHDYPPGPNKPTSPPSEWTPTEISAGTKVYHCTAPENVGKILGPGSSIRPAGDPAVRPTGDGANRWGGGELGFGFYTHTEPDSASSYTENGNPIIEFTVKRDLRGALSPHSGWIGDLREDYRQCNDFIRKHDDLGEIKFHHGAEQLEFGKIIAEDPVNPGVPKEFSSYADYKRWYDNGMVDED
ncbi:hypothetical protein GCM10022222_11490 [Amycolatopsis ultiminotia]|uniref:YD repeat-containing protein n=1 Tax=Amycolatopsis ultiminotia TaxID=543629 RepID=A0ABP6VB73_9PSEU